MAKSQADRIDDALSDLEAASSDYRDDGKTPEGRRARAVLSAAVKNSTPADREEWATRANRRLFGR